MKERVLAERYAKALLLLATEQKSLDRFLDEIRRFVALVSSEPNLLKILSYREFSREKKETILKELALKFYLSPEIHHFLKLLIEKDRISLFGLIAESFENFVREVKNVVVAKVTVAEEGTVKPLLEALRKALEKVTSKKVEVELKESRHLIGGFKVELGDTLFDASVEGELDRIKEQWA